MMAAVVDVLCWATATTSTHDDIWKQDGTKTAAVDEAEGDQQLLLEQGSPGPRMMMVAMARTWGHEWE